ncbi:MAG TPA: hypothetical protein VGC21_09500 [Telluria sp.]|jgi:hypothetical protein
MGYHLTILRTSGAHPRPISLTELTAALAVLGGRLALSRADDGALHITDPARGDASPLLILDETVGELWSSGPDDQFISRMIELGNLMGARVRGDEYETYRSVDQPYIHADDHALLAEQEAALPRARWTIWHWRAGFIGVWLVAMAAVMLWKHLRGT